MNGSEKEGLSENEQAIMEKELPGRSFLQREEFSEIALSEKQTVESGGLKHAEIINDDKGQEAYRKKIDYVKEPDPDRGKGKFRNTEEVKAVSETMLTRNDDGDITNKAGTDLHREHSFKESGEFDKNGDLVNGKGEVTEGEKKGETYEKSKTREQKGNYVKETITNSGKHFEDGKLVPFTTVEVNYLGAGDKSVYGYHEADGKRTMEWGTKPNDLDK